MHNVITPATAGIKEDEMFIFMIVLGLIIVLWPDGRPTCAACGEKIYQDSYLVVSAPACVKLHNNKKCKDKWYEIVEQEPYASRDREYIALLDRRRAGEKISEQKWRDFHKSCR